MDKIKKYQDILIEFLNRYNKETGGYANTTMQRRILIDKENNSFQLLAIGWRNDRYTFGHILPLIISKWKIGPNVYRSLRQPIANN